MKILIQLMNGGSDNSAMRRMIILKMRNILIDTKDIKKSSYIWNVIAYTGNSFQSMLLLLVISRKGNMTDAAMFSIAFTVASMLVFMGKYAVRNYQVSDIQMEYTYGDYVCARVVTMSGMALASVFYLVFCYFNKDYSADKIICVILMLGPRFLEAAEDVLHGDLQRHGRLDVAAKIWAIRTWGYIICFTVLYWLTDGIIAAAGGSLFVSAVVCVLLNYTVRNLFPRDMTHERGKVWMLLKNCFPLAVSTFTLVYMANSPKYAVDAVFTSEEQACFNIVFMPVFVITLLGNYIYNPIVKSLASLWKDKQISRIKSIMYRQTMILMLFAGVVALCGKWFGVRLLGIVYKVTLDQYETEFVLLMIAGGALAVFNFLVVISTVIRKQRILLYISVAFSLILLLGNKIMLLYWGIKCMCLFYALVMAGMSVVTFLLDIKFVNAGSGGEMWNVKK